MNRFVLLGLLAMAGCAQVASNPIHLTPVNDIAVQDGTPSASLIGYKGNRRANVTFVFPGGETLIGDAVMTQDIQDSMVIWGQIAAPLSKTSTVDMRAIDDKHEMDCEGSFGPQMTKLTCNYSDGAIYQDDYIAPIPVKRHAGPGVPDPGPAAMQTPAKRG